MTIAPRYAKTAWDNLFPLIKSGWEKVNHPNDISCFFKEIRRCNSNLKMKDVILITLDEYYLDWLKKNNIKHSHEVVSSYYQDHMDDEFWDQRLQESGMTNCYAVFGIPIAMIPHDLQGLTSQYVLTKETAEQLSKLIHTIYDDSQVYVPGWIIKQCDLLGCREDMITCANVYWKDHMRVRYGKYMEQKYTNQDINDLFSPINLVIPFMVKQDILHSRFNFVDENEMFDESLSVIKTKAMTKSQQLEFLEILIKQCPQILSVSSEIISS